MRVNILSLASINEVAILSEYVEYLDTSIKPHELDSLRSLCLLMKDHNASMKCFDGYCLGYSIPQISKQFDLLRIGRDSAVNIELKSADDEDKIFNQLIRNRYYLSSLGKDSSLFSFSCASGNLYKLTSSNSIGRADFNEFMEVLNAQTDLYSESYDNLFDPSNYLVSPFNSPEEFLKGEYFLTSHQEEICNRIEKLDCDGANYLLAVDGAPGTGKTLLIYHIAKHFISRGIRPILIHAGNLNAGQEELKKQGWPIYSIKEVSGLLGKAFDSNGNGIYDVIIIDEAQRIWPHQMKLILDFIDKNEMQCIVGYDRAQVLKSDELYSGVIDKIEDSSTERYKLTKKIRTNRDVAHFIRAMFNLKNKPTRPISHVNIVYFENLNEAKKYVTLKSGYDFITYTPSQIYPSSIDGLKWWTNCAGTAHEVIGQEFDKTIVLIDDIFFYNDSGVLVNAQRGKNPYLQNKMLYQAVTRVRKELEIVVVGNEAVFSKLIGIINQSRSYADAE